MPPSRKSKKTRKAASSTATISTRPRSHDQTNIPESLVSEPFNDPDPSTGPLLGYESFEHEDTGEKGSPKNDGREARQDDWEHGWSSALVDKFGRTPGVWSAIMQLRATIIALDTVNREVAARCNDLEKDGEMDAFKLNVLDELVTFLARKMDAHLEIVNHVRVLGNRPKVTAEDLYRADLWPHDLSSGNGREQPSPTDLPNMRTDQEAIPYSQTSHPEGDDKVASMSSGSNEPTALVKAESATKILVASLLNDDPPSRYQRSSQPSQKCGAERVQIESPTAEDHNNLLAEIGKLKQQTRDHCLKMDECDNISGRLTDEITDRSGSIASLERRVGLMYLVSRLHGGDQKAPCNVRDVFIGNKISNAGEGSRVKKSMDSVLLDITNLANESDIRITSLDNIKHSPLNEKITREGSSISGPQEGLSTEPVEHIWTKTLNMSQDQQLDKEEGTKTLNISQDQHLVEGEGKNSRRSLEHLSEETVDTRRDKSVDKVIEGQKLQKAEYSQEPKSRQDETDEITRLYDEILLLQNVIGEAPENGLNGSSEERTFASAAEAFFRNLANSLTEQDKTNRSEMLDELVKENAYLTEKMKILASVDLVTGGSRVKMRVMQDAVGSQLDQISSAASGTSTSKVLLQDAKPDRESRNVDENRRSDSKEELRPREVADRIEVAPSHSIWQYSNPIREGNTASGSLHHQVPKSVASSITLNLKPNSADMPSGLLAREDAALILASIKTSGQNQPRQPLSVGIIEPTDDEVYDKSMSQDLSTSQPIWTISQSGKPNSVNELQREIFKTQTQIEFKRAVMEDFHDGYFLSQLKDRPQLVVDRSDPTLPNGAENEGQVNNDRERKHDGQPRKSDFSTQLGANITAEMPNRPNDSTKNAKLITNDVDEKRNDPCQLKDVANEDIAAEIATYSDITKLTAKSEIFKEEEDNVVNANSPQEKPPCPQSSSTAGKARERTDEEYEADSEWETRVGGKAATLNVPQEVEYVHCGCDHPFL